MVPSILSLPLSTTYKYKSSPYVPPLTAKLGFEKASFIQSHEILMLIVTIP